MIIDKHIRNDKDQQQKDKLAICLNCPLFKCYEDIAKGTGNHSTCPRYKEEHKKLQEKYNTKRVGYYDK